MSLIPGRTYHRRYGYRWRDAIRAEFWWRVEHGPGAALRRLGYRCRKHAERRATGA
jgi:hypothetical protein